MAQLIEPEGTSLAEILARLMLDLGGEPKKARMAGRLLEESAQELEDESMPAGAIMLLALGRLPQSLIAGEDQFARRRALKFEVNTSRQPGELSYLDTFDEDFLLTPSMALEVVRQANATLLTLEQFTRSLRVPLTELLGMRGVSVLVSAVLVSEIEALSAGLLFSNPHQDGYPDLLPRTSGCLAHCAEIRAAGRWSEKAAWSDPGFGGIEVKATNGNTPPARSHPKPALGEERSTLVRSFDWKAHHQETRRLLGHTWDFIDGIPTISASFWRNDLVPGDWGTIVQPREGGGRTTSVSVMNATGLTKMATGWMVRATDSRLKAGLSRGRMWVSA